MNLDKDVGYLRASLQESLLDLNSRTSVPKTAMETLRDSRVIEMVLLLESRLTELEKKVGQ